MKIDQVIKEVAALQEELTDADGLPCVYGLSVETYEDAWNIKILGSVLLDSEEYESDRPLKDQIIKEMREIRYYLNTVLPDKKTVPINMNNMQTAPKDGTPVLLKFKKDLTMYSADADCRKAWNGKFFVGSFKSKMGGWGFAAPVGRGGITTKWLSGWHPLP